MKRYILIRVDRHNCIDSEVMHHESELEDMEEVFNEAMKKFHEDDTAGFEDWLENHAGAGCNGVSMGINEEEDSFILIENI